MPKRRVAGPAMEAAASDPVHNDLSRENAESEMPNADPIAEDRHGQVPVDTISVSGSRFSTGNRSLASRARSNIITASLRIKHLEERFKIEELEREVSHKAQLLKAKQELEMAQALSDCELADYEEANVLPSNSKVVEYLDGCRLTETKDTELVNSNNNAKPNNHTTPLCVSSLDLPRVELSFFTGDPIEYWSFIRQFENHIENKVADDGQRLLFLSHYCRARAKDAIAGCVVLPPSPGYRRARTILAELFGQPHQVASALLDRLLNSSPVITADAESLSDLAIRMESCLISLTEMNYTSDLNSVVTMETIVRKLPKTYQYQWAEYVDKLSLSGREPKFSDLHTFVSTRARVSRSRFGKLADNRVKIVSGKTSNSRTSDTLVGNRPRSVFASQVVSNVHRCPLCPENHRLKDCSQFLKLEVPRRWDFVKLKRLCFRCLQSGHHIGDCRDKRKCLLDGCVANHNHLLHTIRQPLGFVENKKTCASTSASSRRVALGIVPVRIVGPEGEVLTYAFVDNGSELSMVRQEVIDKLKLSGKPSTISINTVNGSKVISGQTVDFKIRALRGSEELHVERAFTVPSLPITAPVDLVPAELVKWPHLAGIHFDKLTDTHIGLLIGNDVPEAHWTLEQRVGRKKQPFAVRGLLGWMLLGPLNHEVIDYTNVNYIETYSSSIAEKVERLYNTEFAGTDACQASPSVEDTIALSFCQNNTQLSNGHYVVPMPWRPTTGLIPDNRVIALKRLTFLKRRFDRDPEFFAKYSTAIDSMFQKGYAIRVPDHQLESEFLPRWYLPHHAVINPKKPEKLRVVLDCAAKYNGLSLNDQLYQRPDVTSNLIHVLLRFRRHVVAVAADIEEMFMQVRVTERDRGALRFLWWPNNDPTQEPVEYQMVAHPFGATSSPFCATYALRRVVEDFGSSYPESVSLAVKQNFYVDDCLNSIGNVTEAKLFASQLYALLARGGFRLRKWISNYPEVLSDIPECDVVHRPKPCDGSGVNERTLGIEWDATTDRLVVKVELPEKPLTRRGILSSVSSIFDPLGLVSPLILLAKVILQRLCKTNQGWDDPIPLSQVEAWKEWSSNLRYLGRLEVPRCVTRCTTHYANVQLHLFSDASETGYGAVAYARFIPEYTDPYCTLLFAKSRVAPLKVVTIPRLELNAAILAVRIYKTIHEALSLTFDSVLFWTDSAIVLHCVNNTSSRFCTFVANRLAVIHEVTLPNQWHFNPPTCSHRRGVWERMIRSVRTILYSWCREQVLNDDSLNTVFVEVERILNSRPITPPTSDSKDEHPLTPNSLLFINTDEFELALSLSDRYTRRARQIALIADVFWKRWLKEYLPTLQARQRWFTPKPDLHTGDMVLVSDVTPRGTWPLGVVTECEPSLDGRVRTVVVRTKKGVIRRDVRQVCRLEGKEETFKPRPGRIMTIWWSLSRGPRQKRRLECALDVRHGKRLASSVHFHGLLYLSLCLYFIFAEYIDGSREPERDSIFVDGLGGNLAGGVAIIYQLDSNFLLAAILLNLIALRLPPIYLFERWYQYAYHVGLFIFTFIHGLHLTALNWRLAALTLSPLRTVNDTYLHANTFCRVSFCLSISRFAYQCLVYPV